LSRCSKLASYLARTISWESLLRRGLKVVETEWVSGREQEGLRVFLRKLLLESLVSLLEMGLR
jgi:rRNA maturation protein Rpf1